MAFVHDTGIDDSSMRDILSIAQQLLKTRDDLDRQKTKLRMDNTDVINAKKEYDELIKDITSTKRTEAEIFNTPAIQKNIANITKSMDGFYDRVQNRGKELTPIQTKNFIEGFKTLELYSEKFGQNLTGKYQGMYDNITSALNKMGGVVKPIVKDAQVSVEELLELIKQGSKNASDTLIYYLNYGAEQATNKMLADAKSAGKEEIAYYRDVAEQETEIERQKYETMQNMADQLKNAIKSKLSGAGKDEYFKFDLSEFANVQQWIYNIIDALSKMGIETGSIEEDFINLTNKVYIPKDQIDEARNSMQGAAQEAENLRNKVEQLSLLLYQSVDVRDFEQLQTQLEGVEKRLNEVTEEAKTYKQLWLSSYDNNQFEDLAVKAFEYQSALEKTNLELEELKKKYNALIGKGSSTDTTFNGVFNTDNIDKFVDILKEIAKHLNDIKTSLGTVDDKNGFTNIISSVDILLGKLDEMYQKIGTGINNITIDKTNTGSIGEALVSSERDRLMRVYKRVSSSFGTEGKMFSSLGNQLSNGYSIGIIDELERTYNSTSISSISNMTEQINKLRSFFDIIKRYKQELSRTLDSQANYIEQLKLDLSKLTEDDSRYNTVLQNLSNAQKDYIQMQVDYDNISGIRLPASDNSNLNKNLKQVNNKELEQFEKSETTLSDIITKLGEIRDLISEISKKNILGNSVDTLINKLDEVIGKFDKIVADVNIINSNPIGITTNQRNRYDYEPIIYSGTQDEISQEAYDALYKLKNGAELSSKELSVIPEVMNGFKQLKQITNDFTQKYADLGMEVENTADIQTEERKALRDYIVQLRKASGSFSGFDKEGNELYSGEVENKRKAVIVTGLPAAGKSSSLVNPLSEYYKAQVIDSDIIKQMLPEFQNGWGANLVHKESKELNISYLKSVIEDEANVIIPIVGDSIESIGKYIDILKNKNYEIEVALNEVDNNTSSSRNLMRYFETNRFISPSIIREYGNKPTSAFNDLISSRYSEDITGYMYYSNMVGRNERPKLLNSSGNNTELENFLSSYTFPSKDKNIDSEIERVQKLIQYLNNLMDKRQELIALQDQYSPQDEEYGKIQGEISNIDTELTDNGVDVSQLEKAEELIKNEGDAAEESAKKKRDFADANNNDVVQSAENTATTLPNAVDEIKKEGDAATKTAEADKKLADVHNSMSDSESATVAWIEELEQLEGQSKNTGKELKQALKVSKESDAGSSLELLSTELEKTSRDAEILNYRLEQQRNLLNNKTINTTEGFEYSEELSKRIEEASKRIETLKNKLNSVTDNDGLKMWKAEFGEVKALIDGVNSSIAEEESVTKKAEQAQKELETSQKKANEQASKDLSNQNKLLAQFQQWVAKNSLAYKTYGNEIEAVLEKLRSGTKLSAAELRSITDEINKIKTSAASAGKLGSTFTSILGKRFKSLVAYLSTFASFYRVVSYIRSAFTTLKDLDTQLVDLRKTTTMTTSELNEFYNVSSDVAKGLGVTTSEIISQASAWSRLGYSTKEASTEMAKLSSQFASISPGMDTESATDTLVSTMQAYKIGVDDVQRTVMDNINAIGNSMATTNQEIGEMLQRSSAAMKAANNTLEETIALESAAVEITRIKLCA